MKRKRSILIEEENSHLFSSGNPFSALLPEEKKELFSTSQKISFQKGQYLFRSGEPVRGIYSLNSGVVKISQPQGLKEVLVRIASPGDWVGHRSIFTSEVYRGSARSNERTQALFVPIEFIYKIFGSNKDFAYQLIRLIARDLESADRLLFEYRKLNISSRLISLFRVLDQKIGLEIANGRILTAKLSKVELAQMIGASQEAVSRQLSKWKRERLILEENRRLILSKNLLTRIIR